MGDVVDLNTNAITTEDVPVDRIFDSAKEADLESAIIVGFDKDGGFYFASSVADMALPLWFLEKAKWELFKIADAIERGDYHPDTPPVA